MRVILLILASALFLSACGKKAPLRPPGATEAVAAMSRA